jgi:hypothetical protein
VETSPPEDLATAQQAIDDAIEILCGTFSGAPPGPYLTALSLWCSTLVHCTGSREDAIEVLRELAAGCQVSRLQLADQA